MRYQIVRAGSYSELEAAVNRAIERGWVPVGGVSAAGVNTRQAIISQAMTFTAPPIIPIKERTH